MLMHICFVLFFNSCNIHSNEKNIENTINRNDTISSNIFQEITKTEINISSNEKKTGRFAIKKPFFNNKSLDSLVDDIINLEIDSLKNQCVSGDIDLKLEKMWYSERLLSLKLTTSLLFCKEYPSDVVFAKTFNFELNNNVVRKLTMYGRSGFQNYMFDALNKINATSDCFYEKVNYQINDFFFSKNGVHILIWRDRKCNTSLKLNEKFVGFNRLFQAD